MEEIKKCFFCDKIIIPINKITTQDISDFLKENEIEFTLNYTRYKAVIGNKIVCMNCETDLREISNYKSCDCEECDQQDKEIIEFIERNQ